MNSNLKKNNLIFFILASLVLCSCSRIPNKKEKSMYVIDSEIYKNFEITSNNEGMSEIRLNPAPIMKLFEDWGYTHPEAKYYANDPNLKVMTQDEFKNLTKIISPEAVSRIAKENFLQNSRFTVTCIGSSQSRQAPGKEYFLLAISQDINRFRVNLQEYFVRKGGNRLDFDAMKFEPYIPFASTSSDVRMSSKKNKSDCIQELDASEPF